MVDNTTGEVLCNHSTHSFASSDWTVCTSYYVYGPLLSCVILIGLLGNLLSIAALNSPKNRLPQINHYLIALSVWDTGLVCTAFFVYSLPHLLYGRNVTGGKYVLLYPLSYMLSSASYMGSIWMVMISAIDRYFALCRPLAHRLYMGDRSRTKVLLIACSLICIIYNTPRYMEMVVDDCYNPSTATWMPIVSSSGLRTNTIYWISYRIIGGLLFSSAFPFATLSYLSARVSYEVKRITSTQAIPIRPTKTRPLVSPKVANLIQQSEYVEIEKKVSFSDMVIEYDSKDGKARTASVLRRHSMIAKRSGDDHQQALNFMLVAVLLKFLICHSLPTVLDIWESSTPADAPFNGDVIDTLVEVSNFLVVINSTINVFLYALCSRRFRRDLGKILVKIANTCGNDHLENAQRNYTRPPGGNYRRRGSAHPHYERHAGISSPRGSSSVSYMIH